MHYFELRKALLARSVWEWPVLLQSPSVPHQDKNWSEMLPLFPAYDPRLLPRSWRPPELRTLETAKTQIWQIGGKEASSCPVQEVRLRRSGARSSGSSHCSRRQAARSATARRVRGSP